MTEITDAGGARRFLYAVAPDDFVGERKRIVKELRSARNRSAAAEVAGLRKPSAAAWALNRAARESPEIVEAWLDAGATLRGVSANPVQAGRDAVREAISAHREATARLMEVVNSDHTGRPLSSDMLDRVRGLLQAATTDPEAGERLRAGVICEEAPSRDDAAAALPGPTSASAAPGSAPAAPDAGLRPARARTRRSEQAESDAVRRAAALARQEREREKAQRAERAELMAQLERRVEEAEAEVAAIGAQRMQLVAAAEAADERVEAARRSLLRAEAEAEAAHEAARELERPLRDAEQDLDGLRAELDDVARPDR